MLILLGLTLTIAAQQSTSACTTSAIGKRTGHSMTYDASRRQVVMYGGGSGDAADPYPRTLWAWTGERWQCLDDNGPPGRRDAFLAYDVGRQRLVLFGGRAFTSDRQMRFLRDTWEWDGATWKQVDSAGPGPRIHGAVAYDAQRRGIVVHSGGGTDAILRDTWLWNGARWDSLPAVGPPGVGNSLFTMPTGTLVLSALKEESTECTGLMRAQIAELRATSFAPVGATGPCYSAQAPAARTANGVLLFASWQPRETAVTWLFANGTWRRVDESPPRRRGSYAAYDEARDRVVLFGGDSGAGLLDDTWEWTGSAWLRRN